ncbi:GNAT family N-acetyltransferase [Enterococcus rivorum]|uniref:GNAT family N-acetyltransferase n=1 Tax=Enterococcus rivorum TaxID=762845 RepID=UPI00363C892A
MPEAFTEIMRYAFEELKVEAIWCGYFDENEQSKKVQEKAGLRYVRTEMDIEVPLLNLKRTEHFSRITKEEWENISL